MQEAGQTGASALVEYAGRGGRVAVAQEAGVTRRRALQILCNNALRWGVFLRGYVKFCVDPSGGEVMCVASRFIPAGTRVLYMPVSSAITALSLSKEFTNDENDVKESKWMEELCKRVDQFDQEYQCECEVVHHTSTSTTSQFQLPNCEKFCYKKAVTKEKVRYIVQKMLSFTLVTICDSCSWYLLWHCLGR